MLSVTKTPLNSVVYAALHPKSEKNYRWKTVYSMSCITHPNKANLKFDQICEKVEGSAAMCVLRV